MFSTISGQADLIFAQVSKKFLWKKKKSFALQTLFRLFAFTSEVHHKKQKIQRFCILQNSFLGKTFKGPFCANEKLKKSLTLSILKAISY